MYAGGAEPQPSGNTSVCESCGMQPAQVHVAKVEDGRIVSANLCQSCAAELGRQAAGTALVFAVPMAVGSFLGGLLGGAEAETQSQGPEVPDLVCPACGTTAADVRDGGLFGCAGCYEVFASLVSTENKDNEDMQSKGAEAEARRHVGKLPGRAPEGASARREVLRLQRVLRELVELERFEEAAGVRDRLAELGELPRSL